MTEHEAAPQYGAGKPPAEFLRLLIDYLVEPHRRRIGLGTAIDMLAAVDDLAGDGIDSTTSHRNEMAQNKKQGVEEVTCPTCFILIPSESECGTCGWSDAQTWSCIREISRSARLIGQPADRLDLASDVVSIAQRVVCIGP